MCTNSSGVLSKNTRGLQSGDDELHLKPLGEAYVHELEKIMPLVDRAEKSAKSVMGQQKILTQVGSALRLINRQSSDLLEIAEAILAMKLQQNAPSVEISAVGQLVMLTQRIGKSSNEFLTAEGVSPKRCFCSVTTEYLQGDFPRATVGQFRVAPCGFQGRRNA